MQTGNLSHIHVPAGPLGGAAIRALLLMLVVGLIVAGWQAFLSSEERSPAQTTLAAAASTSGGDNTRITSSRPEAPLPLIDLNSVAASGNAISTGMPEAPSSDATVSSTPPEAITSSIRPTAVDEEPSTSPPPARLGVSPPLPAAPALPNLPNAGIAVASLATAPDPSSDLVDLNTATLQQLNALRGGGLIGRAIIRARPYAGTEDLVRKRVLSRSAFSRVKDQVTVR